MKWNLIKVVIAIAVLPIPVQLRLAAQDQQKQAWSVNTPASVNYNFLIASGFLCDPNESTACPAVARAGDGETVEIAGAGTLGVTNKSVTAVGAFIDKAPNGYIVASGVWTATQLVSFESYGLDPGALLRDYPQFRTFAPLAMGRGMMGGPMAGLMAGPVAAGGLAVIRIRLLPDAGTASDGLLRVNCAKGKVPAEELSDGVRLTITAGPVFDEQVSGRTVFLLQRPMPNLAWKQAAAAGAAQKQ